MESTREVLRRERVYVKVTSVFDSTGYMLPQSITWSDGRVFMIDEIKDFRPADPHRNNTTTDCYTVIVRGEIKYLFFEKTLHRHSGHYGRWYVECLQKKQ